MTVIPQAEGAPSKQLRPTTHRYVVDNERKLPSWGAIICRCCFGSTGALIVGHRPCAIIGPRLMGTKPDNAGSNVGVEGLADAAGICGALVAPFGVVGEERNDLELAAGDAGVDVDPLRRIARAETTQEQMSSQLLIIISGAKHRESSAEAIVGSMRRRVAYTPHHLAHHLLVMAFWLGCSHKDYLHQCNLSVHAGGGLRAALKAEQKIDVPGGPLCDRKHKGIRRRSPCLPASGRV